MIRSHLFSLLQLRVPLPWLPRLPQRQHDLARFQGAAVEAGIDGGTQHALGIPQRTRVRKALRLEIGQGLAVDGARGFGDAGLRAAFRRDTVKTSGLDRKAVIRRRQLQSIPQVVQQSLLETPQCRLLASARAQRLDACRIREKNFRVRIPALRELEKQLVQIESAHETLLAQVGRNAVDLRRHQSAGLGLPGPGEEQTLKRPEDALEGGFGAGGAACEQGQPAVFRGEHFENPAGVPIGVVVQDVAWGQRYAPPNTVPGGVDGLALSQLPMPMLLPQKLS